MRVLWCSDSPIFPTGYAQVSRNVLRNLQKSNIEVAQLGFQHKGFVLKDTDTTNGQIPYPVYPTGMHENYGERTLYTLIGQYRPDVVAYLCDSFMIEWLVDKKKSPNPTGPDIEDLKKSMATIFYYPIDSHDVYEIAKKVIPKFDVPVAMSKFGQKLLKKETGIDAKYIPHGVDTKVFRPLTENHMKAFKDANELSGKFVVGSVFRNQSRKNAPALIEAFTKFAKGKKDVVLLLHTDPNDSMGHDLTGLIKELDVEDKVKFTGMSSFAAGFPEHAVNMIYNSMDVHVLSTTGEGFGIPILESMACGVPNIVPDSTTGPELVKGRGWLAKNISHIRGQYNTRRTLVDVDDLARCMEDSYTNRKKLKDYSKKCVDFAQDFDWEKINKMWLDVLENDCAKLVRERRENRSDGAGGTE